MNKVYRLLIICILFINCLSNIHHSNLQKEPLTADTVYTIYELEPKNANYRKAEFEVSSKGNLYFKYDNSTLPTSKITAFRIDFDSYSEDMKGYEVYCTNVDSSTTDSNLVSALDGMDLTKSSCPDGFKNQGFYDGIVRLDETNTKLGIVLKLKVDKQFKGRVLLRVSERFLGADESQIMEDETFSLVPFTVDLPKFRDNSASKVLFYAYTRSLQMYHSESTSPRPEKLFSGNILSVYTNPNMIRQKYQGASIMTLVVNPYNYNTNDGEAFLFEVKLYESNYLLDYYVSSNSEGRPLNKPLLINMTECNSPYYVIVNYNLQEASKNLILDQIYGKMKSLHVATHFTQNTWDEMIAKDMKEVDLSKRQYSLEDESRTHIDVYKIECEFPLMFNFYYTDPNSLVEKMNYGDINIFTLKPYETVEIPFFSSMVLPQIVVEIFNPVENPAVIVKSQEETVYNKNCLIEITPMTLSEGMEIKERAGSNNTRIIIKVGYSNSGWTQIDDYIKYNRDLQTYVFEFPNNAKRYNYTFADLITSGTNSQNNVKYCVSANIGGALKPSSENCFRISQDNPYTLKTYNPLVMYKDYDYDEGLSFYITITPVTDVTTFNVEAIVQTYYTKNRNFEGINNKITIDSSGNASSILTPPVNKDYFILVQLQICDTTNSISTKIIRPLTGEIVVPQRTVPQNTKNYYIAFGNELIDTEIVALGNQNTNVFVKMAGVTQNYEPSLNQNYKVSFDQKTNTLTIDSPLYTFETIKYTVLVDTNLSSKGITLCSFVGKYDSLAKYMKSEVSTTQQTSIQLNFNKAQMKAGDTFEAIVYIEQQTKGQMVFLSDIFKGTVGEIDIDTIHEIDDVYPDDTDYFYKTITASKTDPSFYFTYLPSETLEVPVGAFSIEVDEFASGSFSTVACTFVDNDTDAMSMIEAVEDAIEEGTSYCIGSQSKFTSKRYNYIFKYKYEDKDKPKRMVIKVTNGNGVDGKFSIYMKRNAGELIEHTDYTSSKEYGQEEYMKKSVVPYIIDLNILRNKTSETEYVSKVLFYSQQLEMQVFYLPEDSNEPIKLFCGNILLVYTKPELAQQKYHATTLILVSENLEGEEHASIGGTFRFHTKMFRSDAQIEYFVSQNSEGRSLNFPLSLEMNICTPANNKLYYILNYNKPEDLRTLHLEMVFGSYLKARIAREINAEKWDKLISDSMTDIENYQIDLPEKTQHIDVIEIECKSPLLLNAYYSYDNYPYNNVKEGEIVVKELPSKNSFSFTIEKGSSDLFYYTMSLFNPYEAPSVTVQFSNGDEHEITENSLQTGMLMFNPSSINVINNKQSKTRFIFKIGLGVESAQGWSEVEKEGKKYEGTLFVNNNKYVYKFPVENNKYNFTKVSLLVKSLNEAAENIKVCYSTNLGIVMDASKENCFRTGKYIPYELTFINPLIIGKNYQTSTDKYYIYFNPLDEGYINIDITEEKYDATNRNQDGQTNILTLSNGKAGTILSLPKQEPCKMVVQLKSCKEHSNPIEYILYNGLTKEKIYDGKIYYVDQHGVLYYIENTYIENEIQFSGEQNIPIFTKHSSYPESYSPVIRDYQATFDESKNSVSISKPIFDEEFNITVIVGKRGELDSITQCELATTVDKKSFGDYSYTFTSSTTSNVVLHYIDFGSFKYNIGDEFDLLVYAEQLSNTKLEFMYKIISGKVGKVSGVLGITDYIEDNKYVTRSFKYSSSSNYLYYDFPRTPVGKVASLKLNTTRAKIIKVGCAYTKRDATDSEMVSEVNQAVADGRNMCLGEMQKDSDGFDALINANFKDEKSRLVIQVIYGFGDERKNIKNLKDEDDDVTINLKVAGTDISEGEGTFGTDELIAPIPYVIDLLKIREKRISQTDYVSKVLFYSNTREMEMFYIDEESSSPVSLFTGNIMLVYTNEELIKQKYHGATTMILLTDALSATQKVVIGEKFRFMVKYFNSQSQIQYYLSGNPDGRNLDNPTAIEMTNCNEPYYYIYNYNMVEKENRTLHIDTIFGEKNTVKIATTLKSEDWNTFVSNMEIFEGEQRILEKSSYHFDVIEVTCKLPLLLNVYYTDPDNPKTSNLEIGDISILSLAKGQSQILYLKTGLSGPFSYSFNVYKDNNLKPDIEIYFDEETRIEATENGVYIKDSIDGYQRFTIYNRDASGSVKTRVIFKFGYVIESKFTQLESGVYSNKNDVNRTINLYGYKYDTTLSKLNYTGVDFHITTTEENVKFCYSSNIGTYINPSLQNCFRVGKNNDYTISTLNPLVMYKNYYDGDVNKYYVGFRTVELNQNIEITPILQKYDTTERNVEGAKNKVKLSYTKVYSTILTAPENHDPYIFTHIDVCTKDKHLSYQFLNAYNRSNLGYDGEIPANSKFHFKSIENTKLDTELKLMADEGVEVFVKHVGISEKYQPVIIDIDAYYNNETRVFNWTQPIEGEEFKYTIYIDKLNYIRKQDYTLCDMTEISKLGHYSETLQTNSPNPNITVKDYGPDYKDMDLIIIAEQVNKGKLTILSTTFDSNNYKPGPTPTPTPSSDSSGNAGLIFLIIVLSVAIFVGIVAAYIILRKYKSKGEISQQKKETSMALITNTKNEKLTESQASESNQIDP